ncbi:MAG: hypothetical protein GPJ50_15610 [Candidatus Heimdallarchaeota archaeon]|nr:hypothetical protein [Candidatus Heimdallarchaeota archaeon]
MSTEDRNKKDFLEIHTKMNGRTTPLIWCDTCEEFVTYEATGYEKGYVFIKCDFCHEQLLHLGGNN